MVKSRSNKPALWTGRASISLSSQILEEPTRRIEQLELLPYENSRVSGMATPNPVAPKTGDHESERSVQSTPDMTAFVQDLLVQMQTRFQTMSEGIVAKIDEMGIKIDELEKSISNLKAEMDAETTVKPKTEDESS